MLTYGAVVLCERERESSIRCVHCDRYGAWLLTFAALTPARYTAADTRFPMSISRRLRMTPAAAGTFSISSISAIRGSRRQLRLIGWASRPSADPLQSGRSSTGRIRQTPAQNRLYRELGGRESLQVPENVGGSDNLLGP